MRRDPENFDANKELARNRKFWEVLHKNPPGYANVESESLHIIRLGW